jgi:hypothetical protein
LQAAHGSLDQSGHSINADFSRPLDQAITVLEEVKKIEPSDKSFSTLFNSAAAPHRNRPRERNHCFGH